MVGVKVSNQCVIERGRPVSRRKFPDVIGDPIAGRVLGVGTRWEWLERRDRLDEVLIRFARIDQQGRAVGHDNVGRVPATRTDVVDVEVAFGPGRQDLGTRGGRDGQDDRRRDPTKDSSRNGHAHYHR